MFQFLVPDAIRKHWFEYQLIDDISDSVFEKIREGFKSQLTDKPLVSVNIIAWNEESTILRNLSSLSSMKSAYPVEYIYVDNNSNDRTTEIIKKCGIEPLHEKIRSFGLARQCAMENSRGKYILTGDADTVYPDTWVDAMVQPLINGEGLASYGTYSFVPSAGKSRLILALYEFFRDIVQALRSINHPELVVVGMNFCFPREEAMKIGFIRNNSRMEDGQMAFNLMKSGRIIRITRLASRAWTGTRTIEKSGSLSSAVYVRVIKELKRIRIYFHRHKGLIL